MMGVVTSFSRYPSKTKCGVKVSKGRFQGGEIDGSTPLVAPD